MRFNTFDEVVKYYEATKPILSKNHTLADDIRPIGERRYKWERIVKVDENTYALVDGSWGEMPYNGNTKDEKEINRKTAAILWERREDGEYVSIRGCMGDGYSISRYQFYNNYLPRQLYHSENTRQGQHWIDNRSTGERHVLPKSPYRYDYTNRTIASYEDKSLVFKRDGDKFVRIGEVQVKSKHIDKDKKAEVRPLMRKYYAWMSTVAPILPTDYSARSEYAQLLVDHKVARSIWSAMNMRDFDGDMVKQVLMDEEHPCRVGLACMLLHSMSYNTSAPNHHPGRHERVKDESDHWTWQYVNGRAYTEEETAAWYVNEAKRLKSAYNHYMNKMLDVFAIETV